MGTELVTILVAATLLLLVVAMFRQRNGRPQRRQRGGSAVWNSALVRPKTRPLAPPEPTVMPPRDPEEAGREVMAHLRRLEERSPGLIAQVVPVFLSDTATRLASLKEAVQQRDGVAAHRLAHTLHGSAASVGAATMVRSCAEIIREVRIGAFDGCDRLIAELDGDFESIQHASAAAQSGDAA
jgi:HPt (histidine-containing phosphotransfer) domain-containing protein